MLDGPYISFTRGHDFEGIIIVPPKRKDCLDYFDSVCVNRTFVNVKASTKFKFKKTSSLYDSNSMECS